MTLGTSKAREPRLSQAEFVAGFHALGEELYHHKHRFHLLMPVQEQAP